MKILSVDKPKTFRVELEVTEEEWETIQNVFKPRLTLTETQTKSSGTEYSKKENKDDGTGRPFVQ